MSNYDTVNSFLSSLELKTDTMNNNNNHNNHNNNNPNNNMNINNNNNKLNNKKKKNKQVPTALDKMEDSQKEFNKNKEFTNNFMCFRDMNFKNNLESQPLDLSNIFSEPLESEENLTQRKQKSYLNDKLSDRNNLFSNRKNAPIMDNQPIFSRSTDD